jgi:outer membrane protein OmpA-like peptidoglycan-associated protein
MPAAACDAGPFRIYYPAGSVRLPDQDRGLLDHMKEMAGESGFIRLSGHTDTAGQAERNLLLAMRRVNEAREVLVGLGMPRTRILTHSFGESRSITALDDGTRSWKHHYVLVEIVPAKEATKGAAGRASSSCGG